MSALQEPVVSSTPGGGTADEEEFAVERILDRKFDSEKNKYFLLIKWQGFSDQDNTWEPEENLADCPELLQDFEERKRALQELQRTDPVAAAGQDTPLPMNNDARTRAISDGTYEKIGFGRGLTPQKIIGATDCGGELCFLIKWEGSSVADIVTAREANQKCPQVVIQFYEERIKWNTKRTLGQMLGEEEEDEEEEEESESNDNESEQEEDTSESEATTHNMNSKPSHSADLRNTHSESGKELKSRHTPPLPVAKLIPDKLVGESEVGNINGLP